MPTWERPATSFLAEVLADELLARGAPGSPRPRVTLRSTGETRCLGRQG